MQVKTLMTSGVQACRPGDSLARAAQLMWDGDFGAVPVVGDDGRVVGIITDRDICMAAYTQGCALSERSVDSAMCHQVVTVESSDDAEVAESRMREHRVRRLPVTEHGRIVGMLSINDLVIAAAGKKPRKGDMLSLEGVGTTLAGICQHRSTAIAAQ